MKVLGLYTQGLCVHGPCLSLSVYSMRVCPIQTQLWHSVHTVHPCRPPPHKYLMRVRWPHTSKSSPPRPLSQSQPTATPPHAPTLLTTTHPCRQQHNMSCGCHRGDVAHRRRRLIPGTVACHLHYALPVGHMPPPPPLCATTISLTAGRSVTVPKEAATTRVIAKVLGGCTWLCPWIHIACLPATIHTLSHTRG